ncbi:MAG: sulfatase [Actinomycetota bacterium]|nr:sulfatase [Actinomycetota bacterium]
MKKLCMVAAAACGVLGLITGSQSLALAQDESRPNVLVIVTDDQRALDLDRFQPRTMEWLKDGGTTFPNAYASTPLCCPSRASILSGRYAHNHGVRSNGGDQEAGSEALDHSTTMQRYLQEAGYRTGIVGKLLNGWDINEAPPYWDYFSIFRGGYKNRPWNINGTVQKISTYSTRFVGHRVADFIGSAEATDAQPWMLYVAPFAPHRPWNPERRYADAPVEPWGGNPAAREKDRSDKPPWLRSGRCTLSCGRTIQAGQARLMMSVDDLAEKMSQKLEEFDESNTLVIYISDNGYHWGEHRLIAKDQPYVQSSQVPLMMRWSGHTVPGLVDERFALNIDIAPTVLEAAGIPVGTTPMDGRSLLTDSARNRVHLEHWCKMRGCDRWASTRTHAYQYIERYDADGNVLFREYYDNVADPWQLTNLLRDGDPNNNPDITLLDAQLEPDKSCIGGTCP